MGGKVTISFFHSFIDKWIYNKHLEIFEEHGSFNYLQIVRKTKKWLTSGIEYEKPDCWLLTQRIIIWRKRSQCQFEQNVCNVRDNMSLI